MLMQQELLMMSEGLTLDDVLASTDPDRIACRRRDEMLKLAVDALKEELQETERNPS